MSIYVILGTPGAFDFKAFSESTRRAMALLAPLTDANLGDSRVAQKLSAQAREYVRAVRLGLLAAQSGFTATEDILALAKNMNGTTAEERNDYLVGTLELADKAYTQASETFQVFRNIRATMFALTDELSQTVQAPSRGHGSSTRAQDQALERSIDDLRRGMDVLEAFSSQASALAQWWDWVKVETGSQRQGEPQLAFNCESLKDSTVIARWKLLKNQFIAYSHMAHELEDTYPQFFSEAAPQVRPIQTRTARRQDLRHAVNAVRRQATCCTVM